MTNPPNNSARESDELLAGFHQTVSEQLNSRLSESPKFFGLLVVIATAYGTVLARYPSREGLFFLASALVWLSILWAIWYLAALGYAFRFLQNIQHNIEHQLGWNPKYVPKPEDGRQTGTPPWPTKKWADSYWLLPGIYHAHAGGLAAFLFALCVTFWGHAFKWYPWRVSIVSGVALIFGLAWLRGIHRHYLERFADKHRSPMRAGK